MGRRIAFAALAALLVTPPVIAETEVTIDGVDLRDAIRSNRSSVLEAIASNPELAEITTPDGKTVVMAAAADDNGPLLDALLRNGADPGATNHRGGSALMYAAAKGAIDTTWLLLAHGVDIDARAENGWTAIALASAKGHAALVELLLEHHADPNIPDVYGWTPLMRAAQNRKGTVVNALLKSPRTDVARINSLGQTALHVALELGDCDIARDLVGAGIDPNTPDFNAVTARALSASDGNCPID